MAPDSHSLVVPPPAATLYPSPRPFFLGDANRARARTLLGQSDASSQFRGQQLAGLQLHAMVAAMKKPQRHVFVCTNTRDVGGRPSCGSQGQKVLEALTDALARNADVWATTAVTGCQCLGPCFEGPNVVVYPEAIWYQGVEAADAEIIVEQHLRNGNPVTRLLRQDSDVSEP